MISGPRKQATDSEGNRVVVGDTVSPTTRFCEVSPWYASVDSTHRVVEITRGSAGVILRCETGKEFRGREVVNRTRELIKQS